MRSQAKNLVCALGACVAFAGCASSSVSGVAQSESRSLACNAACQQATGPAASSELQCEECVCDRMASGPAVCTVGSSRK